MDFIIANLSTIIIALIVAGVLTLAVRTLIKDKKSGKSCAGCPGGCGAQSDGKECNCNSLTNK